MMKAVFGLVLMAAAGNAHASIDGNWAGQLTYSYEGDNELWDCHINIARTANQIAIEDVDGCFYYVDGTFDIDGTTLLYQGNKIGSVDDNQLVIHAEGDGEIYDFSAKLADDNTLSFYEKDDLDGDYDETFGDLNRAAPAAKSSSVKHKKARRH